MHPRQLISWRGGLDAITVNRQASYQRQQVPVGWHLWEVRTSPLPTTGTEAAEDGQHVEAHAVTHLRRCRDVLARSAAPVRSGGPGRDSPDVVAAGRRERGCA